ncbi:outer membrane protein transport protein [Nostoc sp. ChiVER01]|uniref:outer membrane protein transport protein n=1 Tax=Nostoc sp. ChiVER01 TaxID=3075382 RepID=UPI002AD22874|nr:outer membrane protein transport protein [Nostoc sp. ChiVER01]MDZ8224960.1 outer membrane protein transport protein [Nostoc sp. ChiVER01]
MRQSLKRYSFYQFVIIFNFKLPNLYAAWSVSDRLKLGIGINVPFGLSSKYDSNWVGRYQAVESKLTTININPTVAGVDIVGLQVSWQF